MSRKSARNGTYHDGERTRPSWYMPIPPIDEDDEHSGRRSLVEIFGTEPPDLPDEVHDQLVAELDRYLVPREG